MLIHKYNPATGQTEPVTPDDFAGSGGSGGGLDSDGNPLPNFAGMASSGTKNEDGNPLTLVYENATHTWTKTWEWTGTTAWAESQWVKAAK